MVTIQDMADWMKENTFLSDSSVYKYSRAVNSVSKEMLEKGVIPTDLFSMSQLQVDVFVPIILEDKDFIEKNQTGNKMYSNALKQYRMFRKMSCDALVAESDVTSAIENFDSLRETEKSNIVKARIGQGLFKTRLLKKYDSRCIVTGVTTRKLLIASHVRPWAVSSNEDRLSEENGLLLSPTFDKLFDCGLITFSNAGNMFVSSQLDETDKAKLHISTDVIYDLKLSSKLKEHLDYHRDKIFVK